METTEECEAGPSMQSPDQSHTTGQQQYPTASIGKYASYLSSLYESREFPVYQKWPPTPSKKYVNLSVIKKDATSLSQAYRLTSAKYHGNIDQILKEKTPIAFHQILDPGDENHGIKCVLIEGAPAVGKTTLAWELCRKWKTLTSMSSYHLVILVRLREKRVQQAKTLSDLIFHRNSKLKEAVATDVEELDGERVLLVFDGFDELPAEQRQTGSIFLDIINGLYLPKSSVVITSRPSVTAELFTRCKTQISKHVEILGFTEQNIRNYAHSVFPNAEELVGFLRYISGNPLVYSMMYIPLNTAIVVALYQQSREAEKPAPKTMTQLYDSLSHALLRRHITEKALVSETYRMPVNFHDLPSGIFKQFSDVCKLAYSGVCNKQLTWNDLPDTFDHLGFMTKLSSLHVEEGPEISYNFFHFTCQEFLAACHISWQSPEEQEKVLSQYSNDLHFQVVWRFVAGLTSFKDVSWETVKQKNSEPAPRWLESDYCLKPLAVHCLYESQDPEACSMFCNETETVGFLPESASPFDCLALSYCITNCLCKWVVDLISAGIDCDALEMFVRGLNNKEPHGTIKALKIGKSNLGLRGVQCLAKLPSSVLKSIPAIKLYDFGLDQAACDELAELLPNAVSLRDLDVCVNPIRNGGAVRLIKSLSTLDLLQLLDIASIPLGPPDIEALSNLIQPQSPLRALKIGDEEMTPESVQLMLKLVFGPSSLQKLDIRSSDLTSSSDTIQTLLGANDNLTTVEFLWCRLGKTVAKAIAVALQKNKSLTVLKVKHPPLGFSPEGAKALAAMLKVNKTLKELVLDSDNSLGDGITELKGALKFNHNLEKLELPEEVA